MVFRCRAAPKAASVDGTQHWNCYGLGQFLAIIALLLGLVGALVWLSHAIADAKRQRCAVQAIQAARGCSVLYDTQYQFQSQLGYERPDIFPVECPPDTGWFGRDFWHDVTYVEISSGDAFIMSDGGELLSCHQEGTSRGGTTNQISSYPSPIDVSLLADLRAIQALWLAGAAFGDHAIAQLAALGSLREIGLCSTSITERTIETLRPARRLENLYLSDNDIGDFGLANMNRNWPLRVLDLANTNVSNGGLSYLAHYDRLTYLSLANTRVSDVGLQHLKTLSSLKRLDLSYTDVTAEGCRELQTCLPKCEIYASIEFNEKEEDAPVAGTPGDGNLGVSERELKLP